MTKVMIVDDSPILRRQLVMFFQRELQFEVVAEAQDGVEAVEKFALHRPDLVTMDMTMPRKGGLQALVEIRAHFPDARILMISAVSDGEKSREALANGAKGYIQKPLRLTDTSYKAELKAIIGAALAG